MGVYVVTGGAGFIGSNLAEELVAQGHEVRVVDNYAGGRRVDRVVQGVEYHDLSILATARLGEVMKGASHVFHLAALPRVQFSIQNPILTTEVNVAGTLSVLEAARHAGVRRVIYSASSSAYGDADTMPLTEDQPVKPMSPYAAQKHIGEILCAMYSRTYGLETVSLRYFNVYGPKMDPNGAYALVIGVFLRQLRENVPLSITGDGEQTRDFTHIQDVVYANLLAAMSDKVGNGEVINIGAGKETSINAIAELFGGPKTYIPKRQEPARTCADNSLAQNLLGWRPTIAVDEGIRRLLDLEFQAETVK